MNNSLLITCEHGGNEIPPGYSELFQNYADMLQTHRGFDAGALLMATELAATFSAALVAATVSRLLIDLNRSIGHPHLYSEATRHLTKAVRENIVRDHYLPYRIEAEKRVSRAIENGQNVIHISSHSFTPELNGERRNADVGLLYDAQRAGEVALAKRWQAALKTIDPERVVRRNYPYNGRADGLTQHFRRSFSSENYIGIELEINQKFVTSGAGWKALRQSVITALRAALSA